MIETLISSKTRIKLLLKFFLNSNMRAYLRHLEAEFGESSNAIRLELNRFEQAGMLQSSVEGNKKYFQANTGHPLFHEVHSIVMKYVGLDRVVDFVINNLGDLDRVYLVGDFSRGKNSEIIDLLLIGDINRSYLTLLVEKAENIIHRKIRYLIYSREEFGEALLSQHQPAPLLLWCRDDYTQPGSLTS
ncbi:MAG: helix-turn-helix domain-containing protein [Bacteroidia bacterium]